MSQLFQESRLTINEHIIDPQRTKLDNPTSISKIGNSDFTLKKQHPIVEYQGVIHFRKSIYIYQIDFAQSLIFQHIVTI